MDLADYFQNARGIGVLSTAGAEGEVDAAIYARPHFIDQETVAFIMADRLTHRNVTENPHAIYAFIEHGAGYKGKRLYLTKMREETDAAKIEAIRRRPLPRECGVEAESRYLVEFRIDRVRPLVGD